MLDNMFSNLDYCVSSFEPLNLCIKLEATDAKYDFCIVKWAGIEESAFEAILYFLHSWKTIHSYI